MTKISTLKKENENILPRTKIEGVDGLKEELEKISRYNETAIEQILHLVEQVSINKEAIGGQDTKITNLESNNTNLEQSNNTLLNRVETLQTGKQNKLVAGENTTLIDNEDGTTTINLINADSSIISNKVNITQEVLWTNANPNQNFAAQSINTNSPMTDFDYIMMTYYDVIDKKTLLSTTIPTGVDFSLEQIYANADGSFHSYREVKYTNPTTLAIQDAFDGNGSARTGNCLPVQLIGFKFLDTLNYSTEEQYTGKHWIDGKKIYQKTFSGSIPTINNLYTQDFDCSNVDTVIDTIKSNLFYVPTSISNMYTRWYIDRTTNKFTIITENSQFVGTYNQTIQYTKIIN